MILACFKWLMSLGCQPSWDCKLYSDAFAYLPFYHIERAENGTKRFLHEQKWNKYKHCNFSMTQEENDFGGKTGIGHKSLNLSI